MKSTPLSLPLHHLTQWWQTRIRRLRQLMRAFGSLVLYIYTIALESSRPPWRIRNTLLQWEYIGYQSMWVVVVSAFLTGGVFALQIGDIFSMFRSQSLIGAITCSALIRELAPIITGFFITGRAGSSMTAEIASMKASDQLDALTVMAVSPISFLVVPRIWGCILALPLLTTLFFLAGSCGAFAIAYKVFQVDYGTFLYHTTAALSPRDLSLLLGKSTIFAWIIGSTSCYFGLRAKKTNYGISHATTASVVTSLILILVVNAIITFVDIVIL